MLQYTNDILTNKLHLYFLTGVFTILSTSPLMAQGTTEITGISSREVIEQKEPYSEWFIETYDNYKVDNAVLSGCSRRGKSDNYMITIVMGTWCPDSRREVPRFYKILDHMVFPMVNTRLLLVDKNKKDDKGSTEGLNIEYVPTFIVYDKGGKELGRIIEKPKKSLEKDLCAILLGK